MDPGLFKELKKHFNKEKTEDLERLLAGPSKLNKEERAVVKQLLVQRRDALFKACRDSNADLVRKLLEIGVSPNTRNRDGKTPLLITTTKGDLPIAKLLLSKGARPDEGDDKRVTALMLASAYGHIEIVKLLIDSGANANDLNAFGGTAVMLAAENRHADIVAFLRQSGANMDLKDADGRTAEDYAAASKCTYERLVPCRGCGRKIIKSDSWCSYCGDINWRGIFGDILFAAFFLGPGVFLLQFEGLVRLGGYALIAFGFFGCSLVLRTLTSSRPDRLEQSRRKRQARRERAAIEGE